MKLSHYMTAICRKGINTIHETNLFWAKQSSTETPEDQWEKLIELEEIVMFRISVPSHSYQNLKRHLPARNDGTNC